MCSRRLSLWQQEQRQPHLALHSEFLAAFANQVDAAHVQNFPFSFLSTASQIGATAWFVSALLWVLLSLVVGQWTHASAWRSASGLHRSARASRAARHHFTLQLPHFFNFPVHVKNFVSVPRPVHTVRTAW